MNIQDKMQEIHHKYGVSEKANYEIQLFVEYLIKKDRAEQLNLSGVSQHRELLFAYERRFINENRYESNEDIYKRVDKFLGK